MSDTSGWDDDPPDDAALLELGRLTWAAILLEDYTQAVCQLVHPKGRKDPTGEQVRKARASLHVVTDEQLRERADSWLERAQDALDARHSVLHATPLVFVPRPGTTPVPGVPRHYLADYGRGRRPAQQHVVSVEALRELTGRLTGAREGWRELAVALFTEWERRTLHRSADN